MIPCFQVSIIVTGAGKPHQGQTLEDCRGYKGIGIHEIVHGMAGGRYDDFTPGISGRQFLEILYDSGANSVGSSRVVTLIKFAADIQFWNMHGAQVEAPTDERLQSGQE